VLTSVFSSKGKFFVVETVVIKTVAHIWDIELRRTEELRLKPLGFSEGSALVYQT